MQPTTGQEVQLGKLVRSFGPNRANARLMLYTLPVFALVGLIFIFSGFGRSRPGDAAVFIIGGIVFLLIAAGLFWGYRRQLTARADVYEQGFLWKHWRGSEQLVHWEDVASVYEFIGYDRYKRRATQIFYTAVLKNGSQVKADMAVENVRSLGAMILSETGKRLLLRLMDAYKAGSVGMFDSDLGFSRQGLVAGGNTLPWEQVEKIHISDRGDLSIHKKGQHLVWKQMIHSRVPSFPVLRAMLHQAVDDLLPGARPVFDDPSYRSS